MSREKNKALVRRFDAEVWNGRNLSLVDELFAASHVFDLPKANHSTARVTDR